MQIVENQNLEEQRSCHTPPGNSRQKCPMGPAAGSCLGNTKAASNQGDRVLACPLARSDRQQTTDGRPRTTPVCVTVACAQPWREGCCCAGVERDPCLEPGGAGLGPRGGSSTE